MARPWFDDIEGIRHLRQAGSVFTPEFDLVGLSRNDVLEMILQGLHIGAGILGWYTLVDFNNHVGEAVRIKVDLLMIWDLTDCAGAGSDVLFDVFQMYVPDIRESRGQVGDEGTTKQLGRLARGHLDLDLALALALDLEEILMGDG